MDRVTLFAHVLLPLPLPGYFTYRVPYEWNDLLQIGQRVIVPFGAKKIYAGIVVDYSDTPPEKYEANYLLSILDDEPLVAPSQLKFWKWMASYYLSTEGEVMANALPAGLKMSSESVLVLNPDGNHEEPGEMDEKEYIIYREITLKGEIKLETAAALISQKTAHRYIKSLYERGLIWIQEEVKERYKPKYEWRYALSDQWDVDGWAQDKLNALEKKAPKQADIIMMFFQGGKKSLSKSQLNQFGQWSPQALKTLVQKGWVIEEKIEIDRLQKMLQKAEPEPLNIPQKKALKIIEEAFKNNKPAYLEGVTGSGKTHLYAHLIASALAEGKQVLMLVPEVALTEHLVSRMKEYFGSVMGVWHHGYSTGEKTELYLKIIKGEIQFVMGPRSAIFAPFRNLGLVVIDEEHETTFKQFDKKPFYQARDASFVLARMQQAHLVLGSSTPSWEMWQAIDEGQMEKALLSQKFEDIPSPEWKVIHMGEAKIAGKVKAAFSLELLEAIQHTIDKKQQIILFQNRKGYVPYISCDQCGHTDQCVNCDITLTYFKSGDEQRCTYCGYKQSPMKECKQCGSHHISMKGYGTERIAEELGLFFPELRIARFDQESMRQKNDFNKVLNAFENGEIEVLVGTQLLSKGIDFKNVGLVGIIDADQLLNQPDFRSHERAYQLMHQVGGRAGRRGQGGVVYIQTSRPTHPVILKLLEDNFKGLYELEMEQRQLHAYPPFTRMVRVVIRHADYLAARNAGQAMAEVLRETLGERVLGAMTPGVGRIRNYYLQHVLIKLDRKKDQIQAIKEFIRQKILQFPTWSGIKGVRIDVDVDPY